MIIKLVNNYMKEFMDKIEAEKIRESLRFVMNKNPQSVHWYSQYMRMSHSTLRSFLYPDGRTHSDTTKLKITSFIDHLCKGCYMPDCECNNPIKETNE